MKLELTNNGTRLAGEVAWNLLLLSAGSILCALAINGILIPKGFLATGFAGVSLFLYYICPPFISLALVYFFLNLPVFLVGWKYVGRRFFLYSIAGMMIFTLSLAWVQIHIPVEDKILCALLAGIITGVGSGIILRSRGSAGGFDIFSVILVKYFSFRLGSTWLVFNSILLGVGAMFFSLEAALYTLIFIFVTSQILNFVVTGLSRRKAVLVISAYWQEIADRILKDARLGVTVFRGTGGYTGQEENTIFAVLTFRDLPRIKNMIKSIDPNAFVVITDTLEVIGQRIGNQPHW